jgi:hypothetical protein
MLYVYNCIYIYIYIYNTNTDYCEQFRIGSSTAICANGAMDYGTRKGGGPEGGHLLDYPGPLSPCIISSKAPESGPFLIPMILN